MPLIFNGNSPKNITYNGNEVKKVIYNGNTVWEKNDNILVIDDMSLSKNGYSLIVENGIITLSGGQDSTYAGDLDFVTNITDLEVGNYICKMTHISDAGTLPVAVKIRQTNYVQILSENFYRTDLTVPFEVKTKVQKLYLYVASNWFYEEKKFKIEIFKA